MNDYFREMSCKIRDTRLRKGLTQSELAKGAGINKIHVVRAEDNVLDVSYANLRKIVESGLGGELELAIKL